MSPATSLLDCLNFTKFEQPNCRESRSTILFYEVPNIILRIPPKAYFPKYKVYQIETFQIRKIRLSVQFLKSEFNSYLVLEFWGLTFWRKKNRKNWIKHDLFKKGWIKYNLFFHTVTKSWIESKFHSCIQTGQNDYQFLYITKPILKHLFIS
jgi:hypothetical protein